MVAVPFRFQSRLGYEFSGFSHGRPHVTLCPVVSWYDGTDGFCLLLVASRETTLSRVVIRKGFRKPQVVGSIPIAGSTLINHFGFSWSMLVSVVPVPPSVRDAWLVCSSSLAARLMSEKSLGLPYVLRARASTSRPDDLLMAVGTIVQNVGTRVSTTGMQIVPADKKKRSGVWERMLILSRGVQLAIPICLLVLSQRMVHVFSNRRCH